MTDTPATHAETLQQVELLAQQEDDQRQAAIRELIDGIHRCELTDPQEIRIQASTLGISLEEIKAELARRDKVKQLRERLADEPALKAKLAKLTDEREKAREVYQVALEKWNVTRDELSPQIDSLTLQVNNFEEIRSQLREVMDDTELAPVTDVEREIQLLTQRRQELMNMLGTSHYTSHTGQWTEPLSQLEARQKSAIAAANQRLSPPRSDAKRWEQQKAIAKKHITRIQQARADAKSELASIEGKIASLETNRQEREAELLAPGG